MLLEQIVFIWDSNKHNIRQSFHWMMFFFFLSLCLKNHLFFKQEPWTITGTWGLYVMYIQNICAHSITYPETYFFFPCIFILFDFCLASILMLCKNFTVQFFGSSLLLGFGAECVVFVSEWCGSVWNCEQERVMGNVTFNDLVN